ncbi:MAG: multidrug effflux MFS transporter, partial [Anaerolineales bacterium]|nr:multidrug effflux MFS transporter [Anaerolineales bacterium]
MVTTKSKSSPSFTEFVLIVSLLMALTALSIDAMLPALSQIGADLQVQNPNERQLVVSMIFLGLSVGQLFFGPLSDTTGRKPAIFGGLSLFMVGAVICMLAPNFTLMLIGRLLQGIGASAPRAVTLALVRDKHSGREMAQVMSFVMTVFILVPMLAPSMGQAILQFAGWRAIFGSFLLLSAVALTWFMLRQPETLLPDKRAPFTLQRIAGAMLAILKNRLALGYTIAAGLISGAFIGYINSAQQVFQELYAVGTLFPILFGVVASAIGLASLLNSRLVVQFGMRFLVRNALIAITALALIALGSFLFLDQSLPIWGFMTYLMLSFFCVGILFGNLNSLAMEPLGHLAGIGAAVVGALSTLFSFVLGTLIGQSY